MLRYVHMENLSEHDFDSLVSAYGTRAANTYVRLRSTYPVGLVIQRLTVTGLPVQRRVGKNAAQWFLPVHCACGKDFAVSVCHLGKGRTVSCKCARVDRFAALNKSHGCCDHWLLKRLRAVHAGMLRRCNADANYVGKNITVCPAWRSTKTFLIWCLKNNYLPGKSLDRIKNALGYGPDNCQFVSDVDNANNRSSSRMVEYAGKTQTLADHCRESGCHYPTVSTRLLSYGWDISRALETPTMPTDNTCLIYLGWRKSDSVFTVGKSSSWHTRKKCLLREGFTVVGVYRLETTEDMGLLEFLLHNWFDAKGVRRGVAPKSKHSLLSPETVSKVELLRSRFKFRTLCAELLLQKPAIKAELKLKLAELEGTPVESSAAAEHVPVNSSVCHQRLIRDQTKAEDLLKLQPLLGDLAALKASLFDLASEPYAQEHRDFIRRYEWLGNPGISIKWCFTARYKGELGGVVLLSEPYHPSTDEALIARGACAGWTPKNLGSRLVMFACRWMPVNTPKRCFVAYADEEAGEVGQIYQACNFKFLGWKTARYGVKEDGTRISFQTLKRTSRMLPWLSEQNIKLPATCFTPKGYLHWSSIPPDLRRRMYAYIAEQKAELRTVKLRRGKYVMLQGRTPAETRCLRADCKLAAFPYPKRGETVVKAGSVIKNNC